MSSQTPITELPQPTGRDKVFNILSKLAEPWIPYSPEILRFIIRPTLEKRLETWLQKLADELNVLSKKVDSLSEEKLKDNDKFVDAMVQAMPIVLSHHQEEMRHALCNAVLNSALPEAPDDTKQRMFMKWLGEMTVWHLKILSIFDHFPIIDMPLDLAQSDWRMNISLDSLAEKIETSFPDLVGQFDLYVSILEDLHLRGLISNLIPSRGSLTTIHSSPVLTPIAREFLNYTETPNQIK